MMDLKNTGLRQKPAKGKKEYPFHMTSVLKKLFPDKEWIKDKGVPDKDGKCCKSSKGGAYKPDFRNEELKMIIEIDGDGGNYSNHFGDEACVKEDIRKTEAFKKLGYKVIRIPMYIQLDAEMIKYYFGIEYTEELYPASSKHGFEHPQITLPSKFCKQGIERFKREMNEIPINVRRKIIETLKERIKKKQDEEGMDEEKAKHDVIPTELYYLLEEA